MLTLAGMAAARGAPLDPLVRGHALGSISMACYGLGAEGLSCTRSEGAAPLPAGVPADQTNM